MRNRILVAALLLSPVTPAVAQVSIQIGLPGINIGINQPVYPQLVAIPGYPVYYDPGSSSNFFFYDGMYWVFQGDNWYASSWYNGPWALVAPQYVPFFILRVPVGYYRHPPAYFHGWHQDGPPRWGERWGNDWEREHNGWDRWDRGSAPRPAPLPVYQKQYSGNRYPQAEQQQALRSQNYRYQPSDAAVRRVEEAHTASRSQHQAAPPPQQAQPQRNRSPEQQQQAQPQPQKSKPQEQQPQQARPQQNKPPEQQQQQAKPQPQKSKPQEQQPQQARPQQNRPPEQQQQAKPQQSKPPEQQPQQAKPQQNRPPEHAQPAPGPSPQAAAHAPEKGGQDKGKEHGQDHEK